MGFLFSIWLIVLGGLGAANLVIRKTPEAREVIRLLAPYQGWIGAVSAVTGLVWLIRSILWFSLIKYAFIAYITYVATGAVQFGLGLLLGIGVLKTFIKAPQAQEKMDQLVEKLSPWQGRLGLAALGLGVWSLLATIIW